METEHSLDELLCQSIALFCQYRLYDGSWGCEEKASFLLEEAHRMASESKNAVCLAKWGCVVECLSQKFYIRGDIDRILGNIDNSLIAYWKTARKSTVEAFFAYLWLGYYFLLRFRNPDSSMHARSRRAMSDILSFLTDIFQKLRKETVASEVHTLFSTDVWGETVYWAELVCDSCICEKQSSVLLRELYDLKKVPLQQGGMEKDILLQQILEFYFY